MTEVDNYGRQRGVTKVYFWIVLALAIVFFVIVRGSHYAALYDLIGDLKNRPDSGITEIFYAVLRTGFGLCIFGSSLAIGHLIDWAISPERVSVHSHVLELGRKATIGAGVWLVAVSLAERLHFSSPMAAIIAATAALPMLIFLVRRASEVGDESRIPERSGLTDRLLALFLLVTVAAAFFASMVSGTYAAGAMFWAFPVLIMSVFGWARENSLSRRYALIAAVLAAAIPAFCFVPAIEFRDVLLVLITVFAAISIFRAFALSSVRWAGLLVVLLVGLTALYFG